MIKVTFEEGIDNITSEVGLYQWDTGQPFEIHGVTGIEVAPKVHFATKVSLGLLGILTFKSHSVS